MFDRTTGLNCEECLEKCTQFQNIESQWICRTLTYDNRWKICDLFAVNGTESPYFLTQYHGRDYFVYLAALPPTDAEIVQEAVTSKTIVSASVASGDAAAPISSKKSSSSAEHLESSVAAAGEKSVDDTKISESSASNVVAETPAPAQVPVVTEASLLPKVQESSALQATQSNVIEKQKVESASFCKT